MSNYISNFRTKISGGSLLQENDVLIAFKSLKKLPGGVLILSKIVNRVAPYFQTVDPIIESLNTRICTANMKKENLSKIILELFMLLRFVMD